MDAAGMIQERRLKQSFVLATLASTIAGTFITGINLFDRVNEKRRNRKQKKLDKGQNKRLDELERRVEENFDHINAQIQDKQQQQQPGRIRDDDLRDSLEQGGPMVKREYDRHYAAMGPQFAEGDLIAQNQLQSQVITLQSTVIKLLEDSLFTGKPPDMAKLYNASELARIGSIRALRDQAERLHQSLPINKGLRPAEQRARPIGLIRRTSSTPSLRSSTTTTSTTSDTSSIPTTTAAGYRRAPNNRGAYGYTGAGAGVVGEPPRKALTYPNPNQASSLNSDSEEEYQKSGPLFCRYAKDLQQNTRMRVDEGVFFSSPGCPACGGTIPSNTASNVTIGGGHIIDKEVVVTERVTTTQPRRGSLSVTVGGNPVPVTELVKRFEDRSYLLTPRFIAKCHRVGAERSGGKGYACYLCFRNRDKDSLLKTVRGLVGHVRDKHDVGEYEEEVDIRRV